MQSLSGFPVDKTVLELLARAGASARNPAVAPPIVSTGRDGQRFLKVRIAPDPDDPDDSEVVRRIPVNNLSEEQWDQLKHECVNLQLRDKGLSQELESIQDEQLRRLIYTLLTFLNPRQVAIVLFLYREAAHQSVGNRVTFKVNDLLEELGYSRRDCDRSFPQHIRSRLHQDLVALHRTELLVVRPIKGKKPRNRLMFIRILHLFDVELENLPRDFDIFEAAEHGYGCADTYRVDLPLYSVAEAGSVSLPTTIDLCQKVSARTSENYGMKLLMLLASQVKTQEGCVEETVVLSKRSLYKNLDLVGKNAGRNTKILWRTIEDLAQQGYLLSARNLPGKRLSANIEFQLNPQMLRAHQLVPAQEA